jgi:hypothetical protein
MSSGAHGNAQTLVTAQKETPGCPGLTLIAISRNKSDCDFSQQIKMAGTGFEPHLDLPRNRQMTNGGGAFSGAILGDAISADDQIREIVSIWATLSESSKAGILALVRAMSAYPEAP